MIKKFLFILLVLTPLFELISADQTQVWTEQFIYHGINKNLSVGFWEQQRMSTIDPSFRLNEFTPNMIWKFNPYLDGMLGVRFIQSFKPHADYTASQMAMMALTPKYATGKWSFYSTQRLDCGVSGGDQKTLFREHNRATYQFTKVPIPMSVFAYDEWHWNFTQGYLAENRAAGGFAFQVDENVTVQLYGMWYDQWTKKGTVDAYPVSVVSVKMNF
ncbi:MAG: DUF2490 domain-containing protein [Verrucomicrobiota bacterium]|nr:DUF2490 domain-containing protein [Verrucomicrobiota bacterium]